MDATTMLLVPLLVLGVVTLFAFAGCGVLLATDSEPEAPPEKPPEQQPQPPPGPVTTPPDPNAYPGLIGQENGLSLKSYWRLGETATTQPAKDIEPVQPMDGTYHGAVSLGPAVEGVLKNYTDPNDTCAKFDGAAEYVEHVYDTALNPGGSFSLEAWVNPEPMSPGAVGTVMASYQLQPVSFGFVLAVVQQSATAQLAQVRIGEARDNKLRTLTAPLGDASARYGWHHLVATYGPEGGANKLRLYVDTVMAEFVLGPADLALNYTPAAAIPPTPPFRIGAGRDESTAPTPPPTTNPVNFFKGRIDEVCLYDKALDATKVTAHFTRATTK